MKILVYGGAWFTNIGNAFINLGCEALLKEVFPDSAIQTCSCLPRWLISHGFTSKESDRGAMSTARSAISAWMDGGKNSAVDDPIGVDSAIDLAGITNCDLLVVYGVACSEDYVLTRGPILRQAKERGIPVLFLGVGGSEYTDRERNVVGEFLEEIAPIAFISRDPQTFDAYGTCSKNSLSGIDNAFFVPSAFRPHPISIENLEVRTFDSLDDPELAGVDAPNLIRCWHMLQWPMPASIADRPNVLLSDMPWDYLSVYAHASRTYSDRVHACVASLAYGNEARLYTPSPRRHLFEAVGAGDINSKLVVADLDLIAQKGEEIRSVVAAAVQSL